MYHNELAKIGIELPSGRGGEHYVRCPKCSDDRKKKKLKTLKVNVDKGVYVCFHCDFKGSVSGRMDYISTPKTYVLPEPPGELKKISDGVIKWFGGRGISNQTLLRYKVTDGIEWMPKVEDKRNTIHFNYYDDKGELRNVKYRDGEKNFKMFQGAQLIPYGMDVAFDNLDGFIVVTEGEIDTLSWYEAGLAANVSVPNGAPPVPKSGEYNPKLEWLDDCWQFFDSIDKIYLALDNDQPGILLRDELARRFGKEKCWIIRYPDGCKDANDVLCKYGKEALLDCFARAEQYPVEGIEDINTEADELMSIFENGLPVGDKTGIPQLDEKITWHPGQVTVVTGAPGHGKTSWLKQLTWWLARSCGWKWFIYSAEEGSTAMAIADIISIATDKTFLRNTIASRVTPEEIEKLRPVVAEHYKFMKIEDEAIRVDDIIAKMKEMVKRFGIRGVIIDNMSTVENGIPGIGESRHNTLGKDITRIRLAARMLGLHVFLVAHPKKLESKDGVVKPPGGYDVSESSHYFNLPDNGITIYRNYQTGQTDIIIWKVRYKYVGETGKLSMTYNKYTGRFYEAQELAGPDDKNYFRGQPKSGDYATRFKDA